MISQIKWRVSKTIISEKQCTEVLSVLATSACKTFHAVYVILLSSVTLSLNKVIFKTVVYLLGVYLMKGVFLSYKWKVNEITNTTCKPVCHFRIKLNFYYILSNYIARAGILCFFETHLQAFSIYSICLT